MKHIGKLEKIQHISYGYYQLAQIDEEVADNLLRIEKYRHSMYFYIQAMEKYIRARIFEINSNKHFIEHNKDHRLDNAIKTLIEILGGDELAKQHMEKHLFENVLGGIKFGSLHNQLRYPFYIEENKRSVFKMLKVEKQDVLFIRDRLSCLKAFLNDLQKLKKP